MIGIRVDGNAHIGTGHLMRCLAIARKLGELGRNPIFFTIDCADAVRAEGFTSRAMATTSLS